LTLTVDPRPPDACDRLALTIASWIVKLPRSAVDRLALTTCAAATGPPGHGRGDRLTDEVGAISDACVAANMSIAPPFLRVACHEVPMPADKKHRLNQV
jgi:hypothetical protein